MAQTGDREGFGVRDYTTFQVFLNKLPYGAMICLGTAVIVLGFGMTLWAQIAAGVYVAYGMAGPFWMIMFICPHCHNYGRSCACGYGLISAKLRRKGEASLFGAKFRRYIPAIVPLWIIPGAAGGIALATSFSWWLVALTATFLLESFVLLPLVADKCECSRCDQREACPWVKWQGAGSK
jgi:hypothetical protein